MASNDDALDVFRISTIDWDAIMAQDDWKTNRPGAREGLLKNACGFALNEEEDWLYGQGFPIWLGFTDAVKETRREVGILSKEISAKAYERHVYYCFTDGTTRHFHGGEEVTTMAEDGCDEKTNQPGVWEALLKQACVSPRGCDFPLNDAEEWLYDQGSPTWLGFTLARQETRREVRTLSKKILAKHYERHVFYCKEVLAKHYERHVYYCFDDGTTRHFHGGGEVAMDPMEVN